MRYQNLSPGMYISTLVEYFR